MIHPLDTIGEGIGTSFLIWYQYLALWWQNSLGDFVVILFCHPGNSRVLLT